MPENGRNCVGFQGIMRHRVLTLVIFPIIFSVINLEVESNRTIRNSASSLTAAEPVFRSSLKPYMLGNRPPHEPPGDTAHADPTL